MIRQEIFKLLIQMLKKHLLELNQRAKNHHSKERSIMMKSNLLRLLSQQTKWLCTIQISILSTIIWLMNSLVQSCRMLRLEWIKLTLMKEVLPLSRTKLTVSLYLKMKFSFWWKGVNWTKILRNLILLRDKTLLGGELFCF